MQCQFCSRIFLSSRRVYRYSFTFPGFVVLGKVLCAECADIVDTYVAKANSECAAVTSKLITEAEAECKRVNLSKPI